MDSNFWPTIQSHANSKLAKPLILALPTGGKMHLIAMKDTIKMVPFVRKKEELFEDTALAASKSENFSVVINGPTYGLTAAGKTDALFGSDPVNPNESLQEGFVVRDKKVIGGRASDMYFISYDQKQTPRYKFGRGYAPTNVDGALGNVGPLLIGGLSFGKVNKYSPDQPDARTTGQPDPKYSPYLTQRSNMRFGENIKLADGTGKIVVAYNKIRGIVLILCQPHGDRGISISGLRDMLIALGEVDSAVYLDGSDSVMMIVNHSFLVRLGSNKNETMITGVGFKY